MLSGYALAKATDMMERDYFSHVTPEGKNPWQWINRGEYDYVFAGENMAMDFITAETVHAAYLKSPTHRQNILNSNFQEIGVAVLHGELNNQPTTLLVIFFATQRSDLPDLGTRTAVLVNQDESDPVAANYLGQPNIAGVQASIGDSKTNEGIIYVANTQKSGKSIVNFVVEYSNIFFLSFLLFLVLSLGINIFVKARVQHASIIIQSLAVVSLLVAIFLTKFHFIEQVTSRLLIL